MTKQLRTWMVDTKLHKAAVPDVTKKRLDKLAIDLIAEELKPTYIKPRRKNDKSDYLADIYTKWSGNFFYFCAKYLSDRSEVMRRDYEMKFARLEYQKNSTYSLSYLRHNGKWWKTNRGLTPAEAFRIISEGGLFSP